MESATAKQLQDKMYEKRKAAASDLEKQIRDCHTQGDHRKIGQIIDQLVDMFSNVNNPLHVRNGGLIGLAGTAISLQRDISPYMEKFVEPILACFTDPENRIRYFSAECLYNIAKVSKGEILVYFNPIFDALSKLAADSEMSVKNGAELLDRLLKDIVAESASVYIPQYPETEKIRQLADEASTSILVPHPDDIANGEDYQGARKAFSLARFIPLLSERIYVVSPFTRSFLVSWITVLDSVPELELITYLPEFLDGLLKYLSDPTEDVRVATENILADFLREIRHVTTVRKRAEEQAKSRRDVDLADKDQSPPGEEKEKLDDASQSVFLSDVSTRVNQYDSSSMYKDDYNSEVDIRDTGAWVPGQGVRIDYPAMVEIFLRQLEEPNDEIQQSTALRWLADFLTFTNEVLVPFTPRLIGAILPNLAHHVPMIQQMALRTNKQLSTVVQCLPSPEQDSSLRSVGEKSSSASFRAATSPTLSGTSPGPSRQSTAGKETTVLNREVSAESLPETAMAPKSRSNTITADIPRTVAALDVSSHVPVNDPLRSQSPTSVASGLNGLAQLVPNTLEEDPFDYAATVNALTIQFLSEHEETRVAALKWLIMLHQKAPKRILAMDDGTFPALLKTLSDSSEEVIKQDLQLIAQISSSSDESYFKAFMVNLLELFSTDRRLLETRGSLIIRQLCLNLNTERIYRTFAEILEKEEDLEFASVIVQKLSMILITSTELADFRRRLKTLETRQDGQALFTTLYRCWCHNAVAVLSLCLLAQAYEHASNLLYILYVTHTLSLFSIVTSASGGSADLEITVPLLVQIDKLVQLIESPVFTYLRLQLLEPDRYPYLFKCLYGLLMLLPQSSAFVSLRNRLSAVNSAGFLHIAPKPAIPSISSTRSKIGREEIKWQELISHFRAVQAKHEKARRQAMGADPSAPFAEFTSLEERERMNDNVPSMSPNGSTQALPATRGSIMRRKGDASGMGSVSPPVSAGRIGALSPLNPRARATGLASAMGRVAGAVRPSSPNANQEGRGRRAPSVNHKT